MSSEENTLTQKLVEAIKNSAMGAKFTTQQFLEIAEKYKNADKQTIENAIAQVMESDKKLRNELAQIEIEEYEKLDNTITAAIALEEKEKISKIHKRERQTRKSEEKELEKIEENLLNS